MNNPNQPIFNLNNIKVILSKNTILNVPSFKFHRGAIYGITGPISSGKSTFLNLLSFNESYEGVMLFEENLFKKKWFYKKSIPEGILIANQYPKPNNQTIKEFLTSEFKDKLNDLKKQYFLKENSSSFWNTTLKDLSKGQFKRLSLIYAIEKDPKVLIIHNYGENFDRDTILEFNKKLKYNSRSKGTTIILSTYNYKQVMDITNILLFLDKGHLSKVRSFKKKINFNKKNK